MKKKLINSILLVLLLSLSFTACSKKESGEKKPKEITIACDYGFQPLIDDLVKDYNLNNKSSTKIEYLPTVEAISKLKSKGVDLVIAYEGLKEEKIKSDTIASDGIAIIVNGQNSIDGISMDQLKDIYKGKTTLWKDINSNLQRIEAIGYESTLDLQKIFENKLLSLPVREQMSNSVIIVRDVKSAKDRVYTAANSIAFIPGICTDSSIKTLKLNGVILSAESIKNNLYPFKSNICAYYNKGEESVSKFVQYIKSDEGKKIIKKHCSDAS